MQKIFLIREIMLEKYKIICNTEYLTEVYVE